MTDINTPGGWNDGLKTRLEGLSPEDKAKLLEMLKQDEDLNQSNEKKENEDLDVFRKDLLEHFYEYDQHLSSKIKELWDKLIKNRDFYFEDTEYGKVWVVKLNWNEYRFLSMDKISEDLMKKYGLKYSSDKGIIRKESHGLWNDKYYHSDVIESKYMPWWSEEDEWVKKMADDISHDLWLVTVNQEFMKEFWDEVMKALWMWKSPSKYKRFDTAEKWLYLYAYLMWPTALWNSFLDDHPTYEWNVEELRGNLAFHVGNNISTYKKEVTPMICALGEDGGKLFFASKKSINEW